MPFIMGPLDCYQFSFIPGSNATALIALINLPSVDRENGCVRSLVTDYPKAFDLIDHNVLCAKPLEIGLKPSSLNWILDF